MRSYPVFLAATLFALSACSPSVTEIHLAQGSQQIPMPKFIARDNAAAGQRPNYSGIRVHELNTDCETTKCPVVWDVKVPEDSPPTEFVYGGYPGFGAQTVVSARELKPGRRYLLVASPSILGDRQGGGTFRFRVTDDGTAVPD